MPKTSFRKNSGALVLDILKIVLMRTLFYLILKNAPLMILK